MKQAYFLSFMLFLLPGILMAQPESKQSERHLPAEFIGESKSYISNRSLSLTSLLQGGGYLSTIGGGMEVTWRPGTKPIYSNFSIGGMINPSGKVTDASRIVTAGALVGYERMFYATQPQGSFGGNRIVRADAKGTQFYARFGMGLGVSGVGKISESSFNYYPAINTTVLIGSLTSVSESTSVYIEIGSRTAWHPSLNEIGFLVGPQINIGIQFSKGPNFRIPRF